MYSFARYIHALLITLVVTGAMLSLTACDITDPPSKRFYAGADFNFGASNYNIALLNPPPEYATGTGADNNYSIIRRFDAMQNGNPGRQSYWLHEKSSVDPAYDFLISSLEGNPVAHLYVRPNGVFNDAPDPVNSQPGLDWWVSFPNGGGMSRARPADADSSMALRSGVLTSYGCTAWIVMIPPEGGE